MLKKAEKFLPEIFVFLFAFVTRFWRLDFPPAHYFDEVYHAFTAQQMFRGNPAAWEWWNPNPAGFAYEWTHPPLAKEFMWLSISVLGNNPFAWRFFSAFFGTGTIILIYFIAFELFKSRKIALLSSAAASLSGLLLVMSRIGMNDSYFLFFSLLGILMFLKDRKLLMGIFLGLSLASKWAAVFTILILLFVFLTQNYKRFNFVKTFRFSFLLIIIPLVIYLTSYTPFFLGHHNPPEQNLNNFQTFIGLQQQMWWYHTRLTATHPYQSTPIQWILDLRPVWLYVDYKLNTVANIYTLENPLFAWFGFASMLFLIHELFKKFSLSKFLIVFCYFFFFIFWIKPPRIMFNYHYLASSAFLAIAIGFTLNKLNELKNGRIMFIIFFLLLIISFIYFYPLWTGIPIPKDFSDSHFWLQSWK